MRASSPAVVRGGVNAVPWAAGPIIFITVFLHFDLSLFAAGNRCTGSTRLSPPSSGSFVFFLSSLVHGLAMALSKEHKKYLQVFLKQYTSKFGGAFWHHAKGSIMPSALCACDSSVSHGGTTGVVMRVASKKHASNLQCEEKQHRLQQQFFSREDGDSDVIRAECLFRDFLLEHNIPPSASERARLLLRKMFPKSDVAKRYACSTILLLSPFYSPFSCSTALS